MLITLEVINYDEELEMTTTEEVEFNPAQIANVERHVQYPEYCIVIMSNAYEYEVPLTKEALKRLLADRELKSLLS